jgi:hypothetical protein
MDWAAPVSGAGVCWNYQVQDLEIVMAGVSR